jgi:hypothetical protein
MHIHVFAAMLDKPLYSMLVSMATAGVYLHAKRISFIGALHAPTGLLQLHHVI